MSTKKLLITGATGQQGGAVVNALLADNKSTSTPFQILALTRDATSQKAQDLASKPNADVVEGDSKQPDSIFSKYGPLDGVYIVTAFAPGQKADAEEAQATPLINASVEHGVPHIVFSSVDRGGGDDQQETHLKHFASKARIEALLKQKTAGTKTQWTILRPTAFMDNLNPNFMGKAFAAMWEGIGDKPLQIVAVRDIGVFAAKAFEDPETYNGRAISLAGDELTFAQAEKVFKETLGYDLPKTWGFVGAGIKLMVKEMGDMFAWFKDEGYGADIQALRREEPTLQDFGTWLKESSPYEK